MAAKDCETASHLYLDRNTRPPRVRGMAFLVVVLGLFLTTLGQASPALAPLTAKERSLLENSGEVSRRMELRHKGARYVAAVSYGVVPRDCDRVFSVLSDPGKHYTKALPATAEVRFDDQGEDSRLWMKHGNTFINGSYTTHFKVDTAGGVVRFWLDQQKPRDVKDLFGYFKVSPWGAQRCLLTAAVAIDPGKGMVASMFRGMISNYVSKSAGRIQRYARRTIAPRVPPESAKLLTATTH